MRVSNLGIASKVFVVVLAAMSAETALAVAPPTAPTDPFPANNATLQPLHRTLTWTATDPEAGPLTYDVYFGDSSIPPLVATNLASASYQTPLLEGLTPYFWRVVARDELGEETSGPLWKFITSNGSPPGFPSNPNPPDQSVTGNSFPTLTWTCTDPDDQPLTYTVHFGFTNPPPAVAVVTSPQYSPPGPLAPIAYHWYIEVSDGTFNNVSVFGWTFTVNPTVSTESTTWGRIKALYKD